MSKSNAARADKSATIHHATLSKAKTNDVTLEEVKGGFKAVHPSGVKATAPTAKGALDNLMKKLKDAETEEEGDEDGEESGKVIVKEKYKTLYKPNGGNCGDKLAKALTTFRATGEAAFAKVCKENKVDPARWESKNKGLKWMALSNILRHRVKRNEEVTINGETIKSL